MLVSPAKYVPRGPDHWQLAEEAGAEGPIPANESSATIWGV